MAQLTLVLGGMRSGKSRHAESLAAAVPPVAYVATAQAGDAEMAERIARHKQRRPAEWQTVEEPWELPQALATLLTVAPGRESREGSILVECLTLWVANLLVGIPGRPARDETEIRAAVTELVGVARASQGRLIIVSNEVGWGIIPDNSLARRFGDVLGEANQQVAGAAGEVYLCVTGIPVRIK